MMTPANGIRYWVAMLLEPRSEVKSIAGSIEKCWNRIHHYSASVSIKEIQVLMDEFELAIEKTDDTKVSSILCIVQHHLWDLMKEKADA